MERLCALSGYRRIQTPGLRGHGALRAHLRAGLRRRAEGDVHVHRPLRPVADAAARGDGADRARVRRARPAPRRRSRRSSTRSRRCTATARPAAAATASTGSSRSRRSAPTSLRSTRRSSSSTTRCCARLGVTDYRLELNSIGCRECRPAYVERLARLARRARRASSTRRRARRRARARCARSTTSPRSRPPCGRLLETAPTIGDSLCEACVEHFAAVRADLDATGVGYELVPTLVRGLDYYSRTTWEFVGPMENENAVLSGGGRYDYLVEEIGGPPTPGVGFGAGIERLLIAHGGGRRGDRTSRRPSTSSSRSSRTPRASSSRRWLRDLRERGIAADTDYAGRSLKGQLTQAGRSGARDDRDPARGRRPRPPSRRAGRTGRARRRPRQTVAMTDDLARPTCAASRARSTSASG